MWEGGTYGSYIRDDLHVDVLRLDHWVRRRLVQAEGVVVVVKLSPLSLLGLILGYCTRAFSLLANCAVVEWRDVMAIASL